MNLAKNLAAAIAVMALCAAGAPVVSVVYAGSLVTPMERDVGPAFARSCGCTYQGEGKGSVALANLIEGGVRNPDVFISADTSLMERLRAAPKHFIASYVVFAKAQLVLGYSAKSPYAQRFAAARDGRLSMRALLASPGIRIGRTDPRLDPKGARTSHALAVMNASPARNLVFPEEELLVRLEAGDLDGAFLYSTEARSRGIPAAPLPAAATAGHDVLYSAAVLRAATNPQGAAAFLAFILRGDGRAALERAGLEYIKETTR